jgi:hypothetical protein
LIASVKIDATVFCFLWSHQSFYQKPAVLPKKTSENLIILRLDDIIILDDEAEVCRKKNSEWYIQLNGKSRSID